MYLRRSGRHKRLPIPMTTPPGNGANGARRRRRRGKSNNVVPELAPVGKNLRQFLWGNNLQLRIGTVGRLLVKSPSAKLSGMAEAVSLHVVVSNFHNQLRTQWFPR